jgi:hypothetical protein
VSLHYVGLEGGVSYHPDDELWSKELPARNYGVRLYTRSCDSYLGGLACNQTIFHRSKWSLN